MRYPRRGAARIRRFAARSLALFPTLAVVAFDVAMRPSQLSEYTRAAWLWYAGCAAVGAIAWAGLVVAAARRRSPARSLALAALAALALLAVGTQLQTWDRYRSYLNWRTALMGSSLLPCLAQQRTSDVVRALALLLAPVVVALGIAVGAHHLAPPRRLAARLPIPLGLG